MGTLQRFKPVGLGMFFLAIIQGVKAEPPRVVNLLPEHGDVRVDPALPGLKVEFDQDMSSNSMSWTGGGPTFPELNGQPYWINARLCVLPIKLKPNTFYQFGINSQRHFGFRNARGEPATSRLVQFLTAPGEGAAPVGDRVEKANQASIEALLKALTEHYSYRDRLGIDWSGLVDDHEVELRSAARPLAFAIQLSVMLEAAQDLHLSIMAEGQTFQPHRFNGQSNFNLDHVNTKLTNFKRYNNVVHSGTVGDDVGYIRINSWNGNLANELKAPVQALRNMSDRKGLIIDVRANGGGNEMLARPLAGCFITEPKVYSKHRFTLADRPGEYGPIFDRVVEPNSDVPTYEGKVVVLIGPIVCSSNESFVAMMQQNPNCTLVGMTTFGSSGNPRKQALPNGVTVMLPSWIDYLADGTVLEGRGIIPDIQVDTSPGDFNNADPVFDRAVEFLRSKKTK